MPDDIIHRSFELTVAPDEEQMGALSGTALIDLLEEYTVERSAPVLLNLAAAPSQDTSYAQVVAQKDRVDWDKVWVVHLDEYIDLPPGHPNTFKSYLEEHIIGHLPLPQSRALYIKDLQDELEHETDDATSNELSADYGTIIGELVAYAREKGGAYIAHIGYGVNGHMAFNEPHVDKWTRDWVIPVQLDETSVQQQYDDYEEHPDPEARYESLEDVPRKAISVTMAGILEADHIICVVPGSHKAHAVKGAVDGELTADFPASMSRLASDFRLFTDRQAAGRLTGRPGPGTE
mgnify:CR=1 FL=1